MSEICLNYKIPVLYTKKGLPDCETKSQQFMCHLMLSCLHICTSLKEFLIRIFFHTELLTVYFSQNLGIMFCLECGVATFQLTTIRGLKVHSHNLIFRSSYFSGTV